MTRPQVALVALSALVTTTALGLPLRDAVITVCVCVCAATALLLHHTSR